MDTVFPMFLVPFDVEDIGGEGCACAVGGYGYGVDGDLVGDECREADVGVCGVGK